MLELAILAFFSVMSYRIATAVRRETVIFAEFKLPRTLALLVFLFPLGPLVLLAASVLAPFPLAHVAALACYLPALLVARKQTRALETAGTNRVRGAQAAITEAFGTALVGLIFVAVAFAFAYGVQAIGQVA